MNKNIKIGNKIIGPKSNVFIVAEAGVNHNGRLDLALKLVDAAAKTGADAVKFQTFKAEQVVTNTAEMAEYQKKNTGKNESQLAMIKKLEFDENWYPKVIAHCNKRGIIFFSTPHGGFASVDLLESLGVPAFKFGSGDLTNTPLLAYAARLGKPMLLGTGMATMAEVKKAVRTIKKAGNNKIIVLHCTTSYPCSYDDVNLLAMSSMMKELGVMVGYSDHTVGSLVSTMAVALGARVIEKHLTLDKNLPGPDHKASSSPDEFKKTVQAIKNANQVLGSFLKKPTKTELAYLPIVRKSIVAAKEIKKGEHFNLENLAIKRPGTGFKPETIYKLIGRIASKNISKDELIKKEHIT